VPNLRPAVGAGQRVLSNRDVRIGIDARPLAHSLAGVARSLGNILRELERLDDENVYYLYSRLDFHLPLENPRWHKHLHSRIWYRPNGLGFQTGARRLVLEDQVDIFWGTGHILPLGLPSKVRKVVTVHDLTWRLFPETMERTNYLMHLLFAERSICRADRVICFSECTARDLEKFLGVQRHKIQVLYPGVLPDYKPREREAAARYIANRFHVSENYICSVGTIEPRKNLSTLIKAVMVLHQRGGFSSQLLIAGGSGWKNSNIYATADKLGLSKDAVKFLGYVPEEDLPLLYSGARLFVFPSVYEGFGLPLIEAMACGAPVVASNVSSIPEVVGDAAVLVSPHRPEGFAEAIWRVMADENLRRRLIERGIQRARDFRYDVSARKVLRVLEDAAAEARLG